MRKRTEDAYPVALRIPMSLYEEMMKAVNDSGMTTTEFILRSIREKLKNYKFESEKTDEAPITRAELKEMMQDLIREELESKPSFTITQSKKEHKQRL